MSKTKRGLPIVEKFDYPFNEMIMGVETWQAGEKTTICLVTLDNGYEVVGHSHCLNADDYDFEIGKEEAYKNACDKIWDVYAFLCAEADFNNVECSAKCCHK